MEKLPYPVLAQIMNFLDPKDLMLSFMPLSQSSFKLVHMRTYVLNYLGLYFKSDSQFPPEVDLYQILKTLAKQPHPESMKFLGFGTSGGMQDCNTIYWVDNLYNKKSWKDYPAQPKKFNINTVGVLSSTQKKARILERIRKCNVIQNFGRDYHSHRGRLYRSPTINNSSKQLLREKGFIALTGDEKYNRVLKEKQKYVAWVECNRFEFEKLQRRKEDIYVLVDPINVEYANSGRNFFIANQFYFSRPLEYTRPVYAFMIFVSDVYVDIEDTIFDHFNDLKTVEELDLFLNTDFGRHLSVSESEDNENFVYRAFRPCNLDLKPVVWGLFLNRRVESIQVELKSYFRGVFLYTKLICPELKFSVSNSNIDAKYVEVRGFEINL